MLLFLCEAKVSSPRHRLTPIKYLTSASILYSVRGSKDQGKQEFHALFTNSQR